MTKGLWYLHNPHFSVEAGLIWETCSSVSLVKCLYWTCPHYKNIALQSAIILQSTHKRRTELVSCRSVMASLPFPSSLPGFLLLTLVSSAEFTACIHYTAKIPSYCLSIAFQTQAERLYIDPRVMTTLKWNNKLLYIPGQVGVGQALHQTLALCTRV